MSNSWRFCLGALLTIAVVVLGSPQASAQPYPADRGQPGDRMIQDYLDAETQHIHATFKDDLQSYEHWQQQRPRYVEEYYYMLGLWPLPEKTPLKPTVTGTFEGDGYTVENLHYQSRPGLYVTGNLYRPTEIKPGERLPAVFYVCGHSFRGRDGNKTAYQSHGIWFAKHGYVCLVVDTLQLGEIAAIHHGTYREERWWWHSRGYTSAGVECWNGVRGIDYLVSRPDVDPERIAVTGISGGGAATFWIAAADERVKVSVPVSGMSDLPSYVSDRVVNGHCDCMFLYNTFEWPWARIAGLVAPRAMLFVNSDNDRIFPMDGNERLINRLDRLYSLYGAGDRVGAVVSVGGHAYREDIRQAAYRFINMHLKDDPRYVTDSEVDLATGPRNNRSFPIPPEKLRVFPSDADIPADELNTTIDEHFVPMADVAVPAEGEFETWKSNLLSELRRVAFRRLPERVPAAKRQGYVDDRQERLESEPGIEFRLRYATPAFPPKATRIVLVVLSEDDGRELPESILAQIAKDDAVVVCTPRGVGATRWTRRNPPNTVERSLVLLGQTADAGRVWDVAAAARYVRENPRIAQDSGQLPVHVIGAGAAGLLAAYAAAFEPAIEGATVIDPPATHMEAQSPHFLNILRVCDVPDMLGLLAPRPLTVIGGDEPFQKTAAIYKAAGAADRLTIDSQAK
jgi:hypothetical protein